MARTGALIRRLDPTSETRGHSVEQTTARLRHLVDSIELALQEGDEVSLARLVAPTLLARLVAHRKRLDELGMAWRPARQGLRWRASRRRPEGPGRCWLLVRFEDLTSLERNGLTVAPALTHELELELDTTSAPWRLWRVVGSPPP